MAEVRGQAEIEKELAIKETKKKWVHMHPLHCTYTCTCTVYVLVMYSLSFSPPLSLSPFLQCTYCWSTTAANYCNESCQQAHWPEHMASCTQMQNQGGLLCPNRVTSPVPPPPWIWAVPRCSLLLPTPAVTCSSISTNPPSHATPTSDMILGDLANMPEMHAGMVHAPQGEVPLNSQTPVGHAHLGDVPYSNHVSAKQ